MHLDTAETQVVYNAAAQPLVGPHAEDVVTTCVQMWLQTSQQTAGQQVAITTVAVASFLLSANELLRPAHVQVLTCAEVAHQLRQTIRLQVSVILC